MSKPSFVQFKAELREEAFKRRRNQVLREINGSALVLFSAEPSRAAKDVFHSYRQESNFFWLTGLEEQKAAVVLRGAKSGPRSILFVEERDPIREKWEGPMLGLKRAKRNLSFDAVYDYEELPELLPSLLKGSKTLYSIGGVNSELDETLANLAKTQVAGGICSPLAIENAGNLIAKKRLIKDKAELKITRHAVDITTHSLFKFLPELKDSKSELHAAKKLEAWFAAYGSPHPAFPTIVASGKNATCLHHSPSLQPLWRRELVLIDCGASFKGYSSDITRTVPRSGKFTTAQAEVYDVVLSALRLCCKKASPGLAMTSLHKLACRELTKGLIDLGILKGDLRELLERGAYRKFFMHGIGHQMGLDVHDVFPWDFTKNFDPKPAGKLSPGQLITIEPGLYFPDKDPEVPKAYRGIGIRLEDDVLITNEGSEVLSKTLPLERSDIEGLLS